MMDRTNSTDDETTYPGNYCDIKWWCKLCNKWYPIRFKHRHLTSKKHITEKIISMFPLFKNCVP